MRFNVDQHARRNLKSALATLDNHTLAVVLALDEVGAELSESTLRNVRRALRLLVEGPEGKFK